MNLTKEELVIVKRAMEEQTNSETSRELGMSKEFMDLLEKINLELHD